MKRNLRNGFTLMEMLIVVAIIAILVSIAIPTFTGQLEKSREAADMANVRSAYAQVVADTLLSADPESIEREVPLHQKVDDFQSVKVPNIGGITPENKNQWIGTPHAGGTCLVYYDNEKGIVLNWNGGSYGRPLKLLKDVTAANSSWEGTKNQATTGRNDRLRSAKTVKLPLDKSYQITFALPSPLSDKQKEVLKKYDLGFGTLIYDNQEGKNSPMHDSGWKKEISEGKPLTIDLKPKAGTTFDSKQDGYLAINFKADKKNSNTGLQFNNKAGSAQEKKDAEVLEGLFQTMLQNAKLTPVTQKEK